MCSDVQRFLDGRTFFRSYMIARKELEWLLQRTLPEKIRFRRAAEALIWKSDIAKLQSCADSCAFSYAASCPDSRFPGFHWPGDVFYGEAQLVCSRVPIWAKSAMSTAPETRCRRKQRPKGARPTLLERSLLRDLRDSAQAFREAVRALTGFNVSWENKAAQARGSFVLSNGDLRACEKVFAQNLSRAERALEISPLTAQDVHDILLCLRRCLNNSPDIAHVVLGFVGERAGS